MTKWLIITVIVLALGISLGLGLFFIDRQVKEAQFQARLASPLNFNYGQQTFEIKLDPNLSSLDSQINNIGSALAQPAINSQLELTADQQIAVTPSQTGQRLDTATLKDSIFNYLYKGQPIPSNLPVQTLAPQLSYQDGLNIKDALLRLNSQPLELKFNDQTWKIDLATALNLIDLEDHKSTLASGNFYGHQINLESISTPTAHLQSLKLTLNSDRLNQYLQTIASSINRPVKESLFNFDGQKVTEFQPPQEGLELDIPTASQMVSLALLTGQTSVNLPIKTIAPQNQLANELGIKQLIGEGVSNFDHSIPNRIYNVTLAASKINGVIVKPGETFSFVNTVGDISGASGYKQAYVIQNGRTVLDDGGGVCQVSTTLFRAVLNAGLPVVTRTAHAYRVGYYEEGFPPGIDATIFSPSVDFKFKNDTPASILIQTRIDGLTLYVDFYGTSDGRVAQLTNPVITNQTPPPPDLRQDDPTLPKGTVKQVDFSAWGANVVFSRTVRRNGQVIIQDSYRSNYKPWQAVYLVGTGA